MELLIIIIILGASAAYLFFSYRRKLSKTGSGACDCTTCTSSTHCKERAQDE